jgi:hypothetical protein
VLYRAPVSVHCGAPLSCGGHGVRHSFLNPQENSMHKFTTLASGIALALASVGAFAQGGALTPRVDQRQANQQARIDAGVASGQLNRREAARLEHQQLRIARAERRAKADGVVTARERRELAAMQRSADARIRAQKHDRQVARRP